MRKILAIIVTVLTIFAVKESIYIFTSTAPDILRNKIQLSIVAVSITFPLLLLTLWLWSGKRKQEP